MACGGPTTSAPGGSGGAVGSASPSLHACVSTAAPGERPWWADSVFYEVFVRSFADSNGDGIGDLRGLIDHLDYLNDGDPSTTNDLGVTALWLMPVAESPSYHGYDVTDYETVESDYGTNDDFRELVAAAHGRGIRIVTDLELNHTSIEHPWFIDAETPGSEHDAWYRWSTTLPAESGPGGRPVWHPLGDRWYYGYFWEGMPDLNLENPAVTSALDDVARTWIEDMGVDGFRLDAARHLIEDGAVQQNTPETFDWLRGFRDRVHAVDDDALVLGEVWDSTSIAAEYVQEGSLDQAFEFDLAGQMLLALKSGDAGSLQATRAAVGEAYPAGGYATFLSNHDQDRAFDVVGQDVAKARQAATLLLTGPGTPVLYYGEEVGLRGRKPDERIRTPLPWDATGPGYGFTTGTPWEPMADGVESINVAGQTDDPASLLSHYRALIRLRADHPALGGTAQALSLEASDHAIAATLRHDPVTGSSVVVLSNLSDDAIPNVSVSLADRPLCGAPTPGVAFSTVGMTPPAVGPITIGPTGGFDAWSIGTLGAHQDVVITLD